VAAVPPLAAPKPAAAAKPAQAPLTVYDHLIANEEDLVGQVAFAMYENERRDWLTSWRSQTGGDPTHEHYTAFISSNLTQGQRQRYRSAARSQLDTYYLSHYEGPSANGEYRQSRAQKEAEAAERRRRFRRGMLALAVSVLVLALIVAGVFLALRYDMFGLFPAPPVR
jgi:hypothetical protein